MNIKPGTLSLVLVSLFCGCVTNRQNQTISMKEALKAAVEAFPEEEYGGIERYRVKFVDTEGIGGFVAGKIAVVFEPVTGASAPGDHLFILINSRTGTAEVHHGI